MGEATLVSDPRLDTSCRTANGVASSAKQASRLDLFRLEDGTWSAPTHELSTWLAMNLGRTSGLPLARNPVLVPVEPVRVRR